VAKYRSPFYPSLRVALADGTSIRFRGGIADVPDESAEAFQAWLEGPYGGSTGVTTADELAAGEADPADALGPGYTPAEIEAYRRAHRSRKDAPSPPADQRTEGVKAAAAIPTLPAGVGPEAMPPAVDPAEAASRAAQELANARAEELGGGAPDDGLDELTNDQLKEQLAERGLKVSGNKDELIARLRGEE
jgi:hypothetical protein